MGFGARLLLSASSALAAGLGHGLIGASGHDASAGAAAGAAAAAAAPLDRHFGRLLVEDGGNGLSPSMTAIYIIASVLLTAISGLMVSARRGTLVHAPLNQSACCKEHSLPPLARRRAWCWAFYPWTSEQQAEGGVQACPLQTLSLRRPQPLPPARMPQPGWQHAASSRTHNKPGSTTPEPAAGWTWRLQSAPATSGSSGWSARWSPFWNRCVPAGPFWRLLSCGEEELRGTRRDAVMPLHVLCWWLCWFSAPRMPGQPAPRGGNAHSPSLPTAAHPRPQPHFTMCSLVVVNAACNVALPLFIDRCGGSGPRQR